MTRNDRMYGAVFPPTSEHDIAAYAVDEMTQGYRDCYRESNPVDFAPGGNHSPAYRWGWQNGIRDKTKKDDGYDYVRAMFIALEREKRTAQS